VRGWAKVDLKNNNYIRSINLLLMGNVELPYRSQRIAIYVITCIVLAVLGFEIGSLSVALYTGTVLSLLGIVVAVIVEIFFSTRTLELAKEMPGTLSAVFREDALMRAYEKMRKDPDCTLMDAIWVSRYSGVAEYFERERLDLMKNSKLRIRRLVNLKKVSPKEWETHLKTMKDFIMDGRYEIRTTDMEDIEFVLCQYQRGWGPERVALLVINDKASNTPRLGIEINPTKNEQMAFAVETLNSWFEREWSRAIIVVPWAE
jgi:hypothetical protein